MKTKFLLFFFSILFINAQSQNVGIGINAPLATLHVQSAQPSSAIIDGPPGMYLRFNESGTYRGYIGSYAGDAADVDFGTGAGNSTGKLHLTISGIPKLTINSNGDVGIGTINPSARLHVIGNMLINGSSTLEFGGGLTKETNAGKIGYGTFVPDALNFVGAGTSTFNRKMWFYNEGGATFEGNVNLNNEAKLTRNTTGSANLVPIAYGTVDGTTATILSGTGNFSVTRSLAGVYSISVNGEDIEYSTHTWMLTVAENTTATFIHGFSTTSSNNLIVTTINYNAINAVDRKFCFVIYKN